MKALHDIVLGAGLAAFENAALRISEVCIATPLLPLGLTQQCSVKPECLQPTGSFKLRGAMNVASALSQAEAIVTASAGNFAQGLAYCCNRLGLPLTVHVPDTASAAKIARLMALEAAVVVHDFPTWWRMLETREAPGAGVFIHPAAEALVIEGNATIGLELARSSVEFDTVLVPVGGGGLIAGIAAGLRAAGRKVRVVACEIESSTPVTLAMAAGRPVPATRGASWVDGIGGQGVLDAMWPLFEALVDDAIVVSHDAAEVAFRTAVQDLHIILEGAGAVALAAAMTAPPSWGRTVAIGTGGNIAVSEMTRILGAAS